MDLMEKYRSKIDRARTGDVILSRQNKSTVCTVTGPEVNRTSPDQAGVIRKTPESAPGDHCPMCHTWNWWESVYGTIVCGYCHPPPADQHLVKMWIQRSSE